MSTFSCGAAITKVMAVSPEDTNFIFDKIKELEGLGATLEQAQKSAVAEAIARLETERQEVLAAVREKLAGMEKAAPVEADSEQETGDFGPILTQFKGDAQGAINALTELQNGEAVAALHHPAVGDIDLVWGKEGTGKSNGFGLAKLRAFHPEILDDLQGAIDGMSVVFRNDTRVRLESATHEAGISLDWFGKQKTWLLTAYEKDGSAASTTMNTADQDKKGDSPSSASTGESVVQPTPEVKAQSESTANDRDHFTLERLNHETNSMEPVTFARGEYVRYSLGEGEIDGISHAKREFSIDGLWYPFGAAYKTESPVEVKSPTVPLSSVIDSINKKHGQGLTDADAVPQDISILDAEKSLWSRITDGTATVNEFKAGFENWVSRKDEIIATLMKNTKDQLLKMRGNVFGDRYRNEPKAELVDAMWRDGANRYVLARSFSHGMGENAWIDGVRNMVDNTDSDQLAQYAQQVKTNTEEAIARVGKIAEAIKNPKTLEDYITWMRATMREGKTFKEARMMLTVEQRAQFDELAATESRSKRKASKDEQRARVFVPGNATNAELIATNHTQKHYDIFVVKMNRVAEDVYATLKAAAKNLGGYYSAFRGNGAIPGFTFKDKANAEAFLKLAQGDNTDAQAAAQASRDAFEDDRSQTAVQRLTEMADKLEAQADASLNQERKTNTHKRASQAASAEASANADKAMAKTMRNIATAIGDGTAKFLDRVRQKVQVSMLQGYVTTAKGDELRAKYESYSEQERHKGEAPTAETADFAEFPTFTAYRSDLATLARQLLEVDGTKLLGQRLLKEADDVSDAYLKFAKENFGKVSAFSSRGGGVAAFGTKADAEAAIARSGYKGKAIAYQVKRGEHAVILSPSEAIERGVWKGDGDKRLTLTPEIGAELVEKIGKAARRGAKVSVPWQLETAHDRRKALARMGIETPAEFRSALREFIGLQEQAATPSKVKELERAMIGRRNDGMDFFPTPESVADEMVDTAGIEPGMAVLEPSAGWGHIAERIRAAGVDPDVGEMSNDRRELLEAKGFNVVSRDFMEMSPRGFTYGDVFRAKDGTLGVMRGSGGLGSNRVGLDPLDANGQPDARTSQWHDRDSLTGIEKRASNSGYDRILMNPPFSDGRDIQHVQHAYTLLKPGGRIVAIMGESAFTNQNKRATEFREWLDKVGGTDEKLPEGSFNDPSLPVNTGANARMVVIDKTNQGVAMFSRGEQASTGLTTEQFTAELTKAFGPKVAERLQAQGIVVPVADKSKIPGSVSPFLRDGDKVYGFYDPSTNRTYAVLENLTPDMVKGVVLHEVGVHFGFEGLLGIEKYAQVMKRVNVMRLAGNKAVLAAYAEAKQNAAHVSQVGEETIAYLVQRNQDMGLVREIIARIKAFLYEKFGIGGDSLTEADLTMLARAAVLHATRTGEGKGLAPAFVRGTTEPVTKSNDVVGNQGGRSADDTTPGVLKDESGNPLVVYHGSPQTFDKFEAKHISSGMYGEGFYFTNLRDDAELYAEGGRVIKANLVMKNPASRAVAEEVANRVGEDDYTAIRKELQNMGYDGVIAKGTAGGEVIYVVFKPEQITQNESTAPDSGGAMFSRSMADTLNTAANNATVNKVVDKLNEHFTHPGKVSWWDKTVGSPYHLAERSHAFKRVFEAVQRFINDVSFYANEAADLAPKLLPKLDTWRDLGKQPISAADNTAIAAPIYQGTLSWTRDEAGKPVLVDDLTAKYADLSDDAKGQMLLRKNAVTEDQLKRWKASKIDVYEGAVRNRFEAAFLKPGVVWTDAELKSLFSLTPEQIGLYKQFRAAIDKSIDNMAKSEMLRAGGKDVAGLRDMAMDAVSADDASILLRDHLLMLATEDPERSDSLTESANAMIDKADKATKLKKEGYAPLSRFGRYSVDVVVDGKREYFGLFETVHDSNKMAAKMKMLHGAANVAQGTMSQKQFQLFQGVTPESLELFGNMLGLESDGDKASDKAFQDYLRLTKNNRSAMKRLIHRKGIAGYSEDVGRTLAAFVYSNARQTAAGLHMGEMGEAVNDIPKVEGELKDAAIELTEYVKNPREEAQALRGLMFAQYLGGSVASAFVNFTQPMTVSFPYLSQFGGAGKAGAALIQAMKDQRSGKMLEPGLARALKIADETGTTQPQAVHELMAQSRGAATLKAGDGTRMGDASALIGNNVSKLALGWGKLFGLAEQINRRSTFIAAYRIAVEQKIADPAGFATKAVNETQFINNKGNKAKFGRGAIGATLMTFKSYSINYLELLHRMATHNGPEGKKAAALMLGMLFLMAGAGGMPGADDLDDVIDLFAQRLGYNFSSQKAKQEFLEGLFGKAGAQFVERGITGLPGAPIDVSGRMSMGNLIPGTGLLLKKSDHTRDVTEVAGAFGDMAIRAFKAGDQLLSGDLGKAILTAVPKAASNFAQGADMASSGMYKDAKGYKVIDTTPTEAAMKAIGFQPASVSKVQEANYLNQRAKDFYSLHAADIRSRWAKGIFEDDKDQVQAARDMMKTWNDNNPDQRIMPNMVAIMRKVHEMRKTKEQRIADTAPKAMRATLRQQIAERAAQ